MEVVNQDNNSNMSFALLNKNLLDIFKTNYPQLTEITSENNNLLYKDQSFNLGYFRLNQLPTMVYEMPPQEFFKIVKVISEVENNVYNEEYYLFTINTLVNKNNLSEDEKNTLTEFTKKYQELKNYEDFLAGYPNEILSKYRQIVNNLLYLSDPNKITEGEKIITNILLSEKSEVGGRDNSLVRTLRNPNVPNMTPEDDDNQFYSKAGFASIILILYSIINAAIILAIHLIK